MTNTKVIPVTALQQVALIGIYHNLIWDIAHDTRTAPSIAKVGSLLNQKFKTKKEAFMFLHDLFKANDIETINICDMGDCPGLANWNMPNQSIGEYILSWEFGTDIKTDLVKLCQICYQDMKKMNCLTESD